MQAKFLGASVDEPHSNSAGSTYFQFLFSKLPDEDSERLE